MNPSTPFIHRPVATTLLTLGVALAGMLAFFGLPVAPLPQVDFPTISVRAALPGASPETMAATVATPLERALGVIAGVNEITSSSTLGNTRVTLQFNLDRDIDGAARDVQAAINAARTLLPSGLPSNPTYRKVNPASAPIMILALTSSALSRAQMFDAASTVLAQRLSQVDGVGEVTVGGGALPAVRVELDPGALTARGLSLENVRTVLTATNANRPKGMVERDDTSWQLGANDQARNAAAFAPAIVSMHAGAAVRLADVAQVIDSVQDVRNDGLADGKPAVLLIVQKEPGANVIDTVERIRALLPRLRAQIPSGNRPRRRQRPHADDPRVAARGRAHAGDRDRAGHPRGAAVPAPLARRALAVGGGAGVAGRHVRCDVARRLQPRQPVGDGAHGGDGICGRRRDHRSREHHAARRSGHDADRFRVAWRARDRLHGGLDQHQPGRGVHPIAADGRRGGAAVPRVRGRAVSRDRRLDAGVVDHHADDGVAPARARCGRACAIALRRGADRIGRRARRGYRASLAWTLRHPLPVLVALLATIALNVALYVAIPKTFFPPSKTSAAWSATCRPTSRARSRSMQQRLRRFADIVHADPAVAHVTGFTGGGQRNGASFFVTLKPLTERQVSADAVVARLRGALAHEPGARLFFVAAQDIRVGGRSANAQYQYTLRADDLATLRQWEPRVRAALSRLPQLADVNTDQQDKGLQTSLVIDRAPQRAWA